jgi:hypothetical protein
MAQSRAHVPQFKDLPVYTGPGLPTRARDAVTGLTNLPPEKYIRDIDPNVEASEDLDLITGGTIIY